MDIIDLYSQVSALVAEEFTGCTVSRVYDVTTKLTALQADSKPRIYVQLDGVESEPPKSGASPTELEDRAEFTLHLIRKLSNPTIDDTDALVRLALSIRDKYMYRVISRTVQGNTINFKLVGTASGTGGELLDIDDLEELQIFHSTIALTAIMRRSIA